MALPDQNSARLVEEARRLRAAGALGRSDVLFRLFDFLLDCSLAGRAPKEIEVAQEVFGKSGAFDMAEDASVRVYIHRLRRKLEEYYAGANGGERLVIPRGEYRLVLANDIQPIAEEADLSPVVPPPREGWRRGRILAAIGLLLIVNALAWYVFIGWRPARPLAAVERTALWRPLVASDRATFIVAGDYFIFGDAPDTMQVTRLVREFEINSREDLDRYMMENPALAGHYIDLNLHYLPVSTGYALNALLPLAADAATHSATPLRLIPMSQLTPERLKNSNIVYIGFLSGLGLLRDPLFRASGFTIGASYDELIDRASGRHFVSDWSATGEGGSPQRDYGYLASLPGPAGNRILIVAGTRDAAVMQTAEIAADPVQLAQIAARTSNAEAFEALFEVRTMGDLNLDSTLVLARPLRGGAAWRPNATPQRFPDQMPGGLGGAAAR